MADPALQLAQALQGLGRHEEAALYGSHRPQARRCGPVVAHGDTDITVDEMDVTVGEFYRACARAAALARRAAPRHRSERHLHRFDAPQKECSPGRRPAPRKPQSPDRQSELLDRRSTSARQKARGSHRSQVSALGLRADIKCEREYLTEVTAYATALAMNYITRGKFIQP